MVKKLGDLVRAYMAERGWSRGNPYDPLFREWARVAGAQVATHARLVDVRAGILLVEVDHPGWLQMLQLRQAALLEAARRLVPGVRIDGMKVRLGSGREGPAREGPAREGPARPAR
jgi:predicted nucleic acid-binding Zn ribbon protein